MAITRTPIIDDDGTGTTGTVIDNAWKTEFYNQIDAATVAGLTLLKSSTGTTTNPVTLENLDFTFIPQLALVDTVVFTVIAFNLGGTAPVTLQLLPVENNALKDTILLTGATGAGTLAPDTVGMWRAALHPLPAGGGFIEWLATGAITSGTTQARGFPFGKLSLANFITATPNQVFLQQASGISAGGSLQWSWSVHLQKG
jgi:hypothetical protein